jgi:hypothetical protein
VTTEEVGSYRFRCGFASVRHGFVGATGKLILKNTRAAALSNDTVLDHGAVAIASAS